MVHEVGNDPTYKDIRKFAMNILGEAPVTSEFKGIDVKVAYWSAQTQVLLVEKIDKALNTLSTTVKDASTASSKDAALALVQARRMVYATWGLVLGTVLLAIATAFLVVYTRQLTFGAP